MSRAPIAAAFFLAGLTSVSACNTSGLVGDSSRRNPVTTTQEPIPASQTPTTPNHPNNPNNAGPTTPAVTPPPLSPTTTPPASGTGSGSGSGSNPGIFDVIGGLIKILTDVQIDQPNQNEVIFGGNKTFHIGDGEFNASSDCASEIHAYNLKGTRYFFEFQVLANDTVVDVSIGKICGIDYDASNSIVLQTSTTTLDQKPLAKGQTSGAFTTQRLNQGTYTILVESRASSDPKDQGDHDDYIVGQVTVKGDKPIKAGKVGARP